MFDGMQDNYISDLKKKAKETLIKKDRERYKCIYEIIELYISENNVILSDLDLLTNQKIIYKDSYNLYCDNPFRHANALTNMIAEALIKQDRDIKFLVLKTSIPHNKLKIYYDQREMVELNSLAVENTKIENYKFITPTICKGFYTSHKLKIMPAEIELIELYRKLYDPEYNKEWSCLREYEKKMSEMLLVHNGKKGGSSNLDLSGIKKIMLINFLPKTDFVVVGTWALGAIQSNFDIEDPLQIISPYSPFDSFTMVKDELLNLMPDSEFDINMVEQPLYLPNEYRLKKYSVKILLPCQKSGKCPIIKKTAIEIFTNASYELIPWLPCGINDDTVLKIGSEMVLLRFFAIKIWNLKLLCEKNILHSSIVKRRTDEIKRLMAEMRKMDFFDKIPGLENYIGRYYPLLIFIKNKIKSSYNPPYYPYKYHSDNGSYRQI